MREPFSLPLAANVESANSTRADVIGSIDLVRASDPLRPRARAFSNSFCGCHRWPFHLYDIIMYYVRHFRKPGDPSRRAGLTTTYFVRRLRGMDTGGSLDKAWAT